MEDIYLHICLTILNILPMRGMDHGFFFFFKLRKRPGESYLSSQERTVYELAEEIS